MKIGVILPLDVQISLIELHFLMVSDVQVLPQEKLTPLLRLR